MKKAILYLLAFLAIQVIGGGVVQGIWFLVSGSAERTAYNYCRMLTANHYHFPLSTLRVGIAKLVAYPSLDSTLLECGSCLGSFGTFCLFSGNDA